MEVCRVEEALRGADWVITGEGRFDSQSLQGKVVSGIVKAARRNQVKVAVIAGQVALTEAEWRGAGVGQVLGLVPPGLVTPAMLNEAGPRLEDKVRALALRIEQDE
jgi:glycerate kinase